ncbi:methyltransferase [Thalassomonas sp. RHCl1]|uniref:methyltransferase n=1 Tax=Thalassomonas sp. RHCl1 TaxID=2995320 RepID=UPI00248BD8F5|nr:methyltransferase [Thalassomonas sp. RHCl1]
MLSPFIINDRNLHLDRYPLAQVNRSLQAWDAADEYLVNHIAQHQLIKPDTRVLIFNDLFGALTVNFTENQLFTVNDSFLSICGIKHNLEQNHLSDDNRSQLTSLDPLPDDIDVILYKIPKSKSLLSEQLLKIKQKYSEKVIFIAADRAKEIHTSTLKQFEKYLGTTKTSLAVKKARLVFAELDNPAHYNSPFPTVWPLENTRFSLSNHANVYAREKLDLGARYFIQNLPEIAAGSRVIDLGCGNGVIGLTVLAAQEQAKVRFVDESHMAITSARENIENNLPQVVDNCIFHVNDCLTGFEPGSADVILCNPPFHQQTATTDHIAWQMFNDSFRVLKKGGELRIIGNRQLGYHVKLQRIFGNHKLIATNEKFVTISAIKK